ncbi:MAG: NUDIX domain-containing protein [Kofleriaceae bacterium]
MNLPRPTVAVGAVVFDDDGRVLLVQRGRPPGVGLWTVPGGKVEPGEALAAAVVREVHEEAGLAVTCGPLVEVVERVFPAATPDAPGYHYVILDYLAAPVAGVELHRGSDADAVAWVAWDELPSRPLTDGLVPVLARARALATERRR